MFNNQKYITKEVEKNIPSHIQNLIWYMIEAMPVKTKDYLQIIQLEKITESGIIKQKITHMQEQPKYRKEHILPLETAVNAKLYVIDDGSHSTMLLAEEY